MPYSINIDITLADEDDIRLKVTREYRVDALSEIPGVIDHAGRCLALASEGVEKFGLEHGGDEPDA
jgi:hypothetical protein